MAELQKHPDPESTDEEIDLRDLFRILWQGKLIICSITVIFALVSIFIAIMLPNIYRADALLAPNDRDNVGGLSALAAQYGGLASLAGIALSPGSNDKTTEGLEILRSRKFITEFIERHNLLVPLMAANGWDDTSRELAIDPNTYDVAEEKWVRDVSPPKTLIPSEQEAYESFSDILSVTRDKKSGFVTVSIEHYSPDIAKQWVDLLIEDLNSTVLHRDVTEAEQAIEYLNEQVETTSLSGLKEVFFSLIEEQIKTVMLAKVTKEYLFKTLDPAVSPEEKAKPRRSLIVVFSTLFGGFIALLVVFAIRGNHS